MGCKVRLIKQKYRYFLSRIWDVNTVMDKWATVKNYWLLILKGNEYRDNIALRKDMFNNFSQTKFHISRVYNSKRELTNAAHQYAAFVVGSDQLWLPSNIEADYYTLNFVPDNVSR